MNTDGFKEIGRVLHGIGELNSKAEPKEGQDLRLVDVVVVPADPDYALYALRRARLAYDPDQPIIISGVPSLNLVGAEKLSHPDHDDGMRLTFEDMASTTPPSSE